MDTGKKTGLDALDKKASLALTIDASGAVAQIRTGTRGVDAPNVSDWPDGLVEKCDHAVKSFFPEGTGFFVSEDGPSIRYTKKLPKPEGVREV